MNMWIQFHDFSSNERQDVDVDQAKQTLSTFDWQSELVNRDQEKEDSCDPGLGLIADNGSILHICPRTPESCYIHYHYSTPRKVFGFIPVNEQTSHFIESCSIHTATRLIEHHFDDAREEILKVS